MSRITAIETAIPSGIMPNLLLVRIHTEDGFIGCGETYYTPHAIAALIHDWMAERLLGADALAIESPDVQSEAIRAEVNCGEHARESPYCAAQNL
jgi:L-alanine-DL-glutamate epimerase-like enolase superfamily enzyme